MIFLLGFAKKAGNGKGTEKGRKLRRKEMNPLEKSFGLFFKGALKYRYLQVPFEQVFGNPVYSVRHFSRMPAFLRAVSIISPIRSGVGTTKAPHCSNASILEAAVPFPPEMMAPA